VYHAEVLPFEAIYTNRFFNSINALILHQEHSNNLSLKGIVAKLIAKFSPGFIILEEVSLVLFWEVKSGCALLILKGLPFL
jgi:hypothetical protein